jgi:hypothetical protein
MRKKGGIAHRKEKSRWEAEQLRAKEEQGNLKKSEQEKKEEGKPVPSGWNAEWASFNQDQKLREEEREKQEECAEEKEIEDQVMEELWVSEKRVVESKEGANGVSPMQVDGPTDRAAPNAMEDTEDAPEAKIYTVEEEQSMNTIVQFFLDGGDQGEEEDVIWQKLTLKVICSQSHLNIEEYTMLTFDTRWGVKQQRNGLVSSPSMIQKLHVAMKDSWIRMGVEYCLCFMLVLFAKPHEAFAR